MDNLCHTLVGAALAESGLKRRSAGATATLVIGANLPDVDIVSAFFGHALAFRRGWTHGILALVVLPLVLAGLVVWFDRWIAGRRGVACQARPRVILGLAALAVFSHPLLDWLNVYGMRWLMPFQDRWFYGDALFIVDPWLWLVLGTGWLVSMIGSRRDARWAPRPARIALAVSSGYIVAMIGITQAGRRAVQRDLELAEPATGRQLMVAPAFARPLHRDVVLSDQDRYWLGRIAWTGGRPSLDLSGESVRKNFDEPRIPLVEETEAMRELRVWARFPYYVVEGVQGGGRTLRLDDARYGFGRPGWAGITTPIPGY